MINPHIHVPYRKISQYIEFIIRNKLNLEIYFNSDSLDSMSADSIHSLNAALNYNPSLSIHAPFMDLCPGAVDSKVRHATMERFNHALSIAGILKAKSIVFHSGYEKWKYALETELWLKKSLETWQPVNERAKKLGVKIAVENIFEDEPESLKLLMETMNDGNFGICFDAGHCNLFTKVSFEKWLDALKPYIIELHLHDNDRSSDQHLPIGDGNVDFKLLFDKLKDNNCIYTIENHSPESVLASMERLARFFGDC